MSTSFTLVKKLQLQVCSCQKDVAFTICATFEVEPTSVQLCYACQLAARGPHVVHLNSIFRPTKRFKQTLNTAQIFQIINRNFR
jgi:hypothetical protein